MMLSALPIVIVFLFYVIYRQANPVFAELSDKAFNKIVEWIGNIFKHISFIRIMFVAVGVFLLSGVLFQRGNLFFANEDGQFIDKIHRKKNRIFSPHILMHFKNEFLSGIILLVLMNTMNW